VTDFQREVIELADMISALSPSNQRLVRELVMKLQPSSRTTRPVIDIEEIIPKWTAHLWAEGRSSGTIKVYSGHLRVFLAEFPQPTSMDIDAHLAVCRGRGCSSSYINIRIAALKSFFGFCLEQGYIASDPTARIKNMKIPLRETKSPPPDDVKRLLSLDLSARDRALICVLADGGLRVEEVSHIKVGDIGEDSVKVVGKGDKQRTVYLSRPAMKAIATLKEQVPEGESYLFQGRYPGTHWSMRAIEDRLDHLCKEAGIERITPHQLRHFYATEMLNAGAKLRAVSESLGHSSTDITARVYWHIDSGHRRREHERHSPLESLMKKKRWMHII